LCLLLPALRGLGIWQVDRLRWKLDLIDRVEARLAAPPEVVERPQALAALAPRELEYRKIRVTGTFDHGRETLVEALTEQGSGFWVLTPLRTAGEIVLINRGFVPKERRTPASRAGGQLQGVVSSLASPASTSRKAASFAPTGGRGALVLPRRHRDCSRPRLWPCCAPSSSMRMQLPIPGGYPIGGLTVVSFRNTHLIYALTWFALAA
jgi:surfeit locus 1 family protein